MRAARPDTQPGARLGLLGALQQRLLPKPARWHLALARPSRQNQAAFPTKPSPSSLGGQPLCPCPGGRAVLGVTWQAGTSLRVQPLPRPQHSPPLAPPPHSSSGMECHPCTCGLSWEDRLRKLGLLSLEKRWLRGTLPTYPNAFVRPWRDRTRAMASHCQTEKLGCSWDIQRNSSP